MKHILWFIKRYVSIMYVLDENKITGYVNTKTYVPRSKIREVWRRPFIGYDGTAEAAETPLKQTRQ